MMKKIVVRLETALLGLSQSPQTDLFPILLN